MTGEMVLLMGPPAGGKSTKAEEYVKKGYTRLNRDLIGGTLSYNGEVYRLLRQEYAAGKRFFVLDNLYATRESRAVAIKIARELGMVIRAVEMTTTPEQAQFFAARRQIQRYGKLLTPEDYKLPQYKNDPNAFPPAAQFAYWKGWDPLHPMEGFNSVQAGVVKIDLGSEYTNEAIIFDFDGTIRRTRSGRKYPVDPDDIEILPGRATMLRDLYRKGVRLLGASNQPGVSEPPGSSNALTREQVDLCFRKTCEMLGVEIDVMYATERGGIPKSYWRKPMPGMGVYFIEKYKLDPAKCIYVGDLGTGKTFADRCGFRFVKADEFFR